MPLLAVTGANGFVGCGLISAARKAGWEVRGLVRSEDAARKVREAGAEPVRLEALGDAALPGALAGAAGVVHLAQIGAERGRATYPQVNVEGTRRVVRAAAAVGVRRIVYFSGLGVAHFGQRRRTSNEYFRSKLLAEAAVLESGLTAAVFRPSYIVGPGDGLVTGLLADLAAGEVEQPGDGSYRMQPLALADAAEAILAAVSERTRDDARETNGTERDGRERHARVIDLVGPEPLTYRALLGLIARIALEEGRAGVVGLREIAIADADVQAAAGGYRGMLPDELDCLLCDEVADPGPLEALLGRDLTPLDVALRTAVRGTVVRAHQS